MTKYVFFLGSHPELSGAEAVHALTRLSLAPSIWDATTEYLLLSTASELPAAFLQQLGGTSSIGEIIAESSQLWDAAQILRLLPTPAAAGKQLVGLSALNVKGRVLRDLGKALKTAAKAEGRRLRFILPGSRAERLNAAQVIFNQLTASPNAELTVIKRQDAWYLVRTLQVQDITKYELRDTKRPVRDTEVGLLPPKLAQVMLNLALAYEKSEKPTVYDPFCGMGTILQEGWLQGIHTIGSDSSPAMINAAAKNTAWLVQHFPVDPSLRPVLFQHDVHKPFPAAMRETVTAIVTEPYLGHALRAPLPPQQLPSHITNLMELYMQFLDNAYSLLVPEGMLLMLLPAFRKTRKSDAFGLLPTGFLDAVGELGYIQQQLIPPELTRFFPESPRRTILYARPDALVGREIALWKKDSSQ